MIILGASNGLKSGVPQDVKKTREGAYLGGHCSIENIGAAYDQLVKHIPKERIIVIGQVQQVIDWLEEVSFPFLSLTFFFAFLKYRHPSTGAFE